jgi:hypothetical protein
MQIGFSYTPEDMTSAGILNNSFTKVYRFKTHFCLPILTRPGMEHAASFEGAVMTGAEQAVTRSKAAVVKV